MTRYSRFLVPVLWLTALAIYILAVMPQAPSLGSDKLEHMAAFFTLAVLAGLALPKQSLLSIGAWLAFFGGAIEITQLIPVLHRDASLYDWLADLCAIAVGLLLVSPLRREAREPR
jgi:VanZ family protein